jgi:hypothetical protein
MSLLRAIPKIKMMAETASTGSEGEFLLNTLRRERVFMYLLFFLAGVLRIIIGSGS